MPAWLKLAYRMGKIGAIKIAIGYTMLLQAGMFFVTDPGNVALFWSYTFMAGLAFGAPTLLHSMMADLTEFDESKTGQKRAGMYFALLATINKLGGASAVGLTLTLADRVFNFSPAPQIRPRLSKGCWLFFASRRRQPLRSPTYLCIDIPWTRKRRLKLSSSYQIKHEISPPQKCSPCE